MATNIGTIELIATIDTSRYKSGAKEIDKANKEIEGSVEQTDGVAKRTTKSLAGLAVKGFKFAAVAATALATAVTAMTLKGGISRALNIEDAQAKLRGLGHDAGSVATIMQNALDSVKGTSFGLDAAATTAANAVASGVKPGEQLAQVLKTVANTSALAGKDMSEMGAIFNKVAASNKVQMDVINQLHDAGVPALALLAKEIGKTAEETAEMASAGEINFATFERAMRKGVGDAAIEMGKTTRGSWANMQAAMSRVGAAIVKDIIPRVRDSIQGLTAWFDANSASIVSAVGGALEAVKTFGAGVINVGKQVAEYLVPKLTALWNTLNEKVLPVLTRLWEEVLKPLIPVIGVAFVGAIGLAIDALNLALTALTPLIDFMLNNKGVVLALAAAFGIVWATMKVTEGINAFIIGMNTLRLVTIPSMITTLGVLRAAFISAIPVLAIAALVAGAINEINKLNAALRKTDENIAKAKTSTDNALAQANAQYKAGKISKERYNAIIQGAYASGTDFHPGGMALVGERGPEIVNLPRGSQVIPNHEMGQVGNSSVTINISGTFATSPTEQRRIAQQIYDRLQEIKRAKGLSGSMI